MAGTCGIERVVRDVPGERDAAREALLHDVRVQLQQLQFLAQRSHVARARLQARAQQVGESRQQPIGALHVDLHERRDGVERVEQEVRLQLRLELRELRFGQVLLQRQQPLALLPPAREAREPEDDAEPQPREQQ